MVHDEVIKTIAKNRGLSEEQVRQAISSYFDGLRYYITHPLEAKNGIIMHGILTFYIRRSKIETFIERLKLKNFKRKPTADTSNIEFYEELLNVSKKYERQKSKTDLDK